MSDKILPVPGSTAGGAAANAASPPAAISAMRVRFVTSLRAGETSLASFVDPFPCSAIADDVPLDQFFSDGQSPAADDQLALVMMPSGAGTPYEWQQKVEAWISGPPGGMQGQLLDVTLRSERVVWRPGQAIIIGAGENAHELLQGVLHFAFHEGELRKLEREIAAQWPVAESDIELTHGVGFGQLSRRKHVNAMTHATTLRRMRFARLEPHLEKASAQLPGAARRLVSELTLQAETSDRLGYLDDRLEVYEDLYELANDRLSEFSYFHKEFWLEILIVFLLIAEVVIMLMELYALREQASASQDVSLNLTQWGAGLKLVLASFVPIPYI